MGKTSRVLLALVLPLGLGCTSVIGPGSGGSATGPDGTASAGGSTGDSTGDSASDSSSASTDAATTTTTTTTTDGGTPVVPAVPGDDAPTVVSVSPNDGRLGVSRAMVTVTFSQDMNPATITGSTFRVVRGGGDVSGTVTYDVASRTATFRGTHALRCLSDFEVRVSSAAQSITGKALAQNFSSGFSTRHSSGFSAQQVLLNEVAAQPGYEHAAEFIELKNLTGSDVELGGAKLVVRDSSTGREVAWCLNDPSDTVALKVGAASYFLVGKVHQGGKAVQPVPAGPWADTAFGFTLNGRNVVELWNQAGVKVDEFRFRKARNYFRDGSGAWAWYDAPNMGTPKSAN